MDDLKACRTCLAMSGKMIEINSHSEQRLKDLLGHKILYSADIPQFLCYECAALLAKSHKFMMRCLTSQTALFDILQDQNQITVKDLKSLNRRKLQLESPLTYYSEPTGNIYSFEHQDELEEEVEVKQENFDNDDSYQYDADNTHDVLSFSYNTEVKEEGVEVCDDDEQNGHQTDDSDYEPPQKLVKPSKPKQVVPNISTPEKTVPNINTVPNVMTVPNIKPVKKLSKTQQRMLKEDLKRVSSYRQWKGSQQDFEIEKLMQDSGLEEHFFVVQLTIAQQIAELRLKKNTPNYRESPYKCDICFIGYLQEDTFNNHMSRHEVSFGLYSCDVCQVTFKTGSAFTDHCMKHALRFHCLQCAFVGDQLEQAKKHKECHDGVTLKCQLCNEVSKSLVAHLAHMGTRHPDAFVCTICGYCYTGHKSLEMHQARMHKDLDTLSPPPSSQEGAGSSLRCDDCDLTFHTYGERRKHLLTDQRHAPKVDIDISASCQQCGTRCPSPAALRTHLRLHALGSASRVLAELRLRSGPARGLARKQALDETDDGDEAYPAQCEHCEETMKNRMAHFQHYKSKHKDQVFPVTGENLICDQCGQGFPTNAELSYHIRSHTAGPRLKCPDCRKPFFSREKLLAHRKTHSERSLACDICGKTCNTKLGLEQHVKNHMTAGSHPCLQCHKTFSRAAGLALHVKKRHATVAPPSRDDNE